MVTPPGLHPPTEPCLPVYYVTFPDHHINLKFLRDLVWDLDAHIWFEQNYGFLDLLVTEVSQLLLKFKAEDFITQFAYVVFFLNLYT